VAGVDIDLRARRKMVSRASIATANDSRPQLTLASTSSGKQRRLILFGLMLLIAGLITRGISKGEFDYNVDESQHAATGLFVSSLLHDLPLRHPVAYTYRYYAQYPALSGVIHWPPIFYGVEGLIFLGFGASVVTARLTILLFALVGWFYWYRWNSETIGEKGAVLATLLIALLPTTLLFERTVMLEIPCLSLCIIALYQWHRYLIDEKQSQLYLFASFFAAALLTKQSSIFVSLVCLLTVALMKKWRLVLNRRIVGPMALLIALAGPFYTLVYIVHWRTISMDLLGQQALRTGSSHWGQYARSLLFYVKVLPEELGWPLLILAIVGIFSYRLWSQWEPAAFMLAWTIGGYITFTAIHHKEARYSFYWIPPFIFFVAGLLTAKWRMRPLRALSACVAILLAVHSLVTGWTYQRPYVEGYAALASRIGALNAPGVILFDAPLPANFIFFLRKIDRQRGFVVLRKALWVSQIKLSGGYEELARTVSDVDNVIDRDGVKYVVVSDSPKLFDAQRSLLSLVHTDPRFELIDTVSIGSNQRDWQNQHLFLYRNNRPTLPASEFLTVRMMTLSHDVVVPWRELNQAHRNQTDAAPVPKSQ
jgi:4-amino-4-deoxy-L-arabinose transferase-like glycosyltransferase